MDRAPQLPYALLDDPYIDPLIRRQNLRALTRPTTMAVSSETDRRLREILQGSGGLNPAVRQPRRASTAIEAPADPNAMVQPAPVPMNFGDNRVTDAVLDEFAPAQPDGPATVRPTPRGNPRVSRPSGGGIPVSPIEEYVKQLFASTANPLATPPNRFAQARDAGLARDAANAEFAYEPPPTADLPVGAAPEAEAAAEAPPGAGIGLPPGAMLYQDTANDPLAQAIAAAQDLAQAPAAETGAAQPPQGDTPPPPAMAPRGGAMQNPALSGVSGVPAPPAPVPRPEVAAQAAAQSVAEAGGTPEQQQAAALSAYERASQAARERVQAILAQQEGAGISDRDKWLSLALGGARMAASRNPTFFGALGEGAEAGIQNFAAQDRLAKDQARARTGQQLQAEQLAETAGDRAERRVNQAEDSRLRHLDRKDRNQARAQELEFRYKDLQQRAADTRLSREERAEAAREATAARLEIAKIYSGSRENVAGTAADARVRAAELQAASRAARAAGGSPARIREAEELVTRGKAPDFDTAYDMVRAGVGELSAYQRNVQAVKNDLRKGLTDVTGKLTITEAELEDRARQMLRDRTQPGTTAPRPAAPAAAPAAAPTQTAPAAGNIARPTTPAEANALPPGTRYITPDGRQLVR